MADDRALVPVVGKALEVALLVLLVAVVSASLFGAAVPTYRATVGDEVGERALQHAASEVEAAAAEAAAVGEHERVVTTVGVALPATIRGQPYRIRAVDGSLVLRHPRSGVGGRARLALPAGVSTAGTWRSDRGTELRVVVRDGGATVRLVNR